ncbi:MAG TPA: AlpA family transcriptional regulator [Maribacter sp.]|nr:AlpA family transcriptional regulator [Maribacter sp.]|tara:strand:+ start:222 stop:437 length:216 start_codon:yes stop_codon:yes gene_type:complete
MNHPSKDKLLKAQEVAEWLGVSPSTVYRWVEKGNLPKPYVIGETATRWRTKDLIEWLGTKEREKNEQDSEQ